MPMFPLGSVLLPGMPLPLHVFEPRYQALVAYCLEGEPEFGVVLIERGSEVGGGDARTGVGTVARIVDASRFADGRWAIGAVGTRRIRVERWLPDDPFPRAEVHDWPEEPGEIAPGQLDAVVHRFRRVLALAAELGVPVPPATVELATDPAVAVLQMTVAAPFGPADRYDLLAAAGPVERLALLAELVEGQAELLEGRAAMGDPGDPGDLFGEGYGEDPGGL
jgi:Lon protease-like protein